MSRCRSLTASCGSTALAAEGDDLFTGALTGAIHTRTPAERALIHWLIEDMCHYPPHGESMVGDEEILRALPAAESAAG